jgi:hypothetical protein
MRDAPGSVLMPAARRSVRTIALALAVFALAAAAAVGQLVWSHHHLRQAEPLEELAYYPSGAWLSQAAVGERIAWSDLLWLRAVQYYGLHRETDNTFGRMAHVFDIITTLDPQFQNAYVFGGTSLCQEGHQFDAGVLLLEKGARNNPTAWIYPFELGFVHYLGKRSLTRATFEFAQAARLPNSPDYCERFAAWSGQRAGYEAVAVELWRQVAETTDNSIMREKAIGHLRDLLKGKAQEIRFEAWAASLKPLPALPPAAGASAPSPAKGAAR